MYKFVLVFILSYFSTNVYADSWDKLRFSGLTAGKKYYLSTGSGFFINNHHIITNRHVVENCINIAIRGSVKPTLAKLLLVDEQLDLAVIESEVSPKKVPYLRNNYSELKIGDMLFSIGYPLEKGESGEYVIREAKVISIKKDPITSFNNIEFTDNVNHGNSGGPLLDKNSNLIGVVTAKLSYRNTDPNIPPIHVAFAVGVEGLIDFLKKHKLDYASSSTYDIFTNYHIDRLVENYIVNIHCIKNEK